MKWLQKLPAVVFVLLLNTDSAFLMCTEINAAKGISMRQGLGKLRHIETNQLWLQDKVHRGEFGIDKVDGKYNIADALTKPVGNEDLGIHISGVGIRLSLDRHQLAPKVGNWDEFGGFGVEEQP